MPGDITSEPAADEVLRQFYEAHPYPAPVTDLSSYVEKWSSLSRRRAEFHLFFPDVAYRDEMDILVAGCGTSQAARTAIRWPKSRVVGIDISAESLAHTDELKQRHNLDNLETRRLPVREAAELGLNFDLVICTGVLHHLADPVADLRALVGVLRLGGAMHLMVYGRYGRTGLSMIQEYCRLIGVEPSTDDIDALAETLREVPMNHPISPILRETHDFRSYGGIADALLNPREVTYTVPGLFDLIERAGLLFGRWVHQAPYRPLAGGFAETPHSERLATFPESEQFAAMELLRGTLTRHSTILYREGRVVDPFQSESSVSESVPIRVPESVLIKENLPDGVSAVLLNQAHHDGDLYMPLTTDEERLLEGIEGESTVGELAAESGADLSDVCRFLEKGWIGDHFVFDSSRG
ncbi:MAG: class I SAM-dependent methyltransferase [Acidimicrobiia bacterium]